MDDAMKISHDFVDFKESKEEAKCNQVSKEAVICVGTTGTGKSSLIKLYCGNNVIVGHGVQSKTPRSTLYKESNSERYWLDSQGANDSGGVDDEKVLTDVLKTLYDENITNIKVIWCVSGDFAREKQEFKTQAKFIKSLGNAVWSSCLIVQKKGPLEPDDIDGALAAAKNAGGCIIEYGDKRLFGYTGLDFLSANDKNKDRVLKKTLKYTKANTLERDEQLLEDGYLTNKQIPEHINERLSRLAALKLMFVVKKCEKCGIKGDPRFVYAPCHTKLEKYHPKSTEAYHNGQLRKLHTGIIQDYHDGSLYTNHSTEKYHPSEWKYYNRKSGTGRGRWMCCNQRGDEDSREEGCRERIKIGSTNWTCCGSSSGSSGCKNKYGCCNRSTDSSGCREEWECCGATKYGTGCQRRHKCCKEDEASDGCKDRCQACHKSWGLSVGCIQTTKKC